MLNLNFFALVLVLLSTPVMSGLSTGLYYQYCPGNSNLTIDTQDKTATGPPRVDWISFYQNTDKQSTSLLVVGADLIDDYKFYSYSKTGSLDSARKCIGSAAYNYLGLMNEYLLLSSGSNYYVCKYTEGTDSTPVLLTTTGIVGGSLLRFMPHMVASGKIYATVTNSTASIMVWYTFASTGPLTPTLHQFPITASFISSIGTQNFMFDSVGNIFWNNTGTGWVSGASATNITYASASQTIKGYNLRDGTCILAITKTDKTDRLYTIKGSTLGWTALTSTASTIAPIYFSDRINNLVKICSTNFVWVSLTTSNLVIGSVILSSEISNLDLVLIVGLSQNKAVFYYSNAKIEYFKHVASGNVQKLFSRTVVAALTLTSNKHYHLSLSCLCIALRNTFCNSQTLTCVILNRATTDCKGSGDTYISW